MKSHDVYLLLGANISPELHMRSALYLLRNYVEIKAISPIWETPAVGSNGPNFLNLAVHITTFYTPEELKFHVLRKIEGKLGRTRTEDKNAPRPMDMDILIYDNQSLEPDIWLQAHIACPLSGLLPDLVDLKNGIKLSQLALTCQQTTPVRQRTDLHFEGSLF